MSKDSVTITVDAVCYFKKVNPVWSVANVTNAEYATRLLAATTLRNILGTKTLQEILQEKESIANRMQVSEFVLFQYILTFLKFRDVKIEIFRYIDDH